MLRFPKIKNGQVALLRADAFTGHILDEMFQLYTNNISQKVYTIFASKKEAIEYINSSKEKFKNIDLTIYDSDQNILEYFPADMGSQSTSSEKQE